MGSFHDQLISVSALILLLCSEPIPEETRNLVISALGFPKMGLAGASQAFHYHIPFRLTIVSRIPVSEGQMSPKRENLLWKTQKNALLSNFGVLVGGTSGRVQTKSETTTTFEVNDGDGIVAQALHARRGSPFREASAHFRPALTGAQGEHTLVLASLLTCVPTPLALKHWLQVG